MKIAITGNIACGKSTVLGMLREQLSRDFVFGSVDDIVHSLYADPDYLAALEQHLGVSDRKAVSDLVFANPDKKRLLEYLADRFIRPRFERMLDQPNLVVEFPLLFESAAWCAEFDLSVAVVCEESIQAERIFQRDGIQGEKLAAIRGSQLAMSTKRALADVVIDTGEAQDGVLRQVNELVATIRQRKAAGRVTRELAMEREMEERFMCRFQSAPLWQIVRQAYSEPHRHYHVLAHPFAMFRMLDAIMNPPESRQSRRLRTSERGDPVHRPLAIELAIWFHDLVYNVDARYPRNEMESARQMFTLLKEFSPSVLQCRDLFYSDVAVAIEMIVSTQKHQITSPLLLGNPHFKSDAELFLDIDLGILSQSETVVDQFDADIRQEFSVYSDADFAKGRAQALGSFLARERIYFSPDFQDREPAARANLERLVSRYTQSSSQ